MKKSSFMRKIMVLMMVLAVVVSYSVVPMNQSFAASGKRPAKVKSVKAVALGDSETSINVSWKKAKHAKKYQVYRATKKKGKYKKIATVKTTSYVNKGLKDGKKYYYKVRAVNGKKKGKFSKIKAATAKYVAAAPTAEVKELPVTVGAKKGRTMVTDIDMTDSKYDGKLVRVWVPIAQSDSYQTVTIDEKAVIDGIKNNADKVEINTDPVNGNKMLYIEWGKNTPAAKRTASFRYNAERAEISRSELVYDSTAAIPEDVKPYITESSTMVNISDPIVKDTAAEIVKGKNGTLEQAKAIYDWVIANLERIDNNEELKNEAGDTKKFIVMGCGYGDTKAILTDLKTFGRAGGHCTDINSTFVALCRAAGIPAREMFGIRLNTNDTSGQHCWTEFYLPGTGWVYADPGDVLKAVKGNNSNMTVEQVAKAKAKKATKEKAKYFWGSVDNNRIVLSRGRDVTFNPAQTFGPCNTFGYPCAEADGVRIECTDAANFTYTISCVNTVTAAALEADLYAGTYKILDTRSILDYEAGHIPGAVMADVSKDADPTGKGQNATATAEENISAAIAGDDLDNTKYALICYSGNKFANLAAKILREKKVPADNIFILGQDDGSQGPNGGMKAWGSRELIKSNIAAVNVETVYVTPEWLRSAMAGDQPGYENLVVAEVSYGGSSKTYASGHIPGAIQVAVTEVEDATGAEGDYKAYNLLKTSHIRNYMVSHGITADTPVVLYDAGGDPCEVGRQAYGYIVAGLKNVKILNGDLAAWKKAGFNTETKSNSGEMAESFGAFTEHMKYWMSMEDAKTRLSDPNFKLVSIRSEDEWLGKTSGYNYMDKAGEPRGAVWGKGAKTAFDVADFVNPDGTVKNLAGLKAVWDGCNFTVADNPADQTQHLSFYCGTGWRATVPFLVLYENGYNNISIYDGGWYEWIMYDENPVQVGDPGADDFVTTTVGDLPDDRAGK